MENMILKGIDDEILSYEYDKFYKESGNKLKNIIDEKELINKRKKEREYLKNSLHLDRVKINLEELKTNFIEILKEENSHQLLWFLNSKYLDNTYSKNYLDEISPIIFKSNQVEKGGINTYKINGWMTHALYVYQIVNYNIAKNIVPINFDENSKNYMIDIIKELHEIYYTLNTTLRFILKLFCFVHDIGVVESEKNHAICGKKYVEEIIEDLNITQEFLDINDIDISVKNLIKIIKAMIEYHIIYSLLSGEGSDAFVENGYRTFLQDIKGTNVDQRDISKILFLFTIGDIIAVNEIIFDEVKYRRLKETYKFFNEIIEEKPHSRNIQEVALERLSDLTGETDKTKIRNVVDKVMEESKNNSKEFLENLYDLEHFFHFTAIMKSLNNTEYTIKLINNLMQLIIQKEGKVAIKATTITWIPNNKSRQAVTNIKNGTLFRCINQLMKTTDSEMIFEDNKVIVEKRNDKIYVDIEML